MILNVYATAKIKLPLNNVKHMVRKLQPNLRHPVHELSTNLMSKRFLEDLFMRIDCADVGIVKKCSYVHLHATLDISILW